MTTQEIITGTVTMELKRWRELERLYRWRENLAALAGGLAPVTLPQVERAIAQLEALDGKEPE